MNELDAARAALAKVVKERDELREEIVALKLARVMDGDVVELVKADNTRLWKGLKKYGKHYYVCASIYNHIIPGTPCNCGFDNALKEPDGE